jgi:hypothetical protein
MTTREDGDHSEPALVRRLPDVNYWWPESDREYRPGRPGCIPTEKSWANYKADFYSAIGKLAWDPGAESPQTRFFAVVGSENTGKTTLLGQLVRLFADDRFRELLWTLPETDDVGHLARGPRDVRTAWAIDRYHYDPTGSGGESSHFVNQLPNLGPNRVLYLPLGADPAFQLRPERQIREAVSYYEREVLDGDPAETRHFVFVDDVDALDEDAGDDGWGELVAELCRDTPARTVVATAASDDVVERQLYDAERDEMRLDDYEIETVLPAKFRDYLQRRYPIFEGADATDGVELSYHAALAGDAAPGEDPDTYRISPSEFTEQTRAAVDRPDELLSALESYESQLDRTYRLVGSGGSDSPRAWIQRALDEYLLLGGYLALALDDDLFERSDETFRAYLRGDADVGGHSFAADAAGVVDDLLGSLHEQAPSLQSIQQRKVRDLSRLYSWVADTLETRPFDYDDLLGTSGDPGDWILDVDRRTLREKYFATLEELVLVAFSDGYGQKKPRHLRVGLRDVGLGNVLQWRGLDDVTSDRGGVRSKLEYMVAFDHVIRFSYNVNHPLDPNCGVVRYWRDGDDFVEFVPKVRGAPVPIGIDTSSDTPVRKIDAVGRFLDRQSPDPDADLHDFVRYEPAVGSPRTGPSGGLSKLSDWVERRVLDALEASDEVNGLGDLWESSVDTVAAIDGLDREDAETLADAVTLYDAVADVRGVGPSKQETLWNPGTDDPDHWTVERLCAATVAEVAALDGFTETTAERVIEAAKHRSERGEDGEYERRIDRLRHGDGAWWDGLREEPGSEYRGHYEAFRWGESDDGPTSTGGASGATTHHRIHDGEAQFGLVLTGGNSVERYESPDDEKPVYAVPLWMFLTLA